MDKKKVKRSVVTAAVAAGMLTNAASDDPAELLSAPAAAYDDHIVVMTAADMPSYDIYLDEFEELEGMDRVRAWMLKLPLPVRAAVLLPLWAVGEVSFAVISALSAAAVTVPGQFLLSLAVQLGILAGIFGLTWKLMSPKTPLREIFSNKRFPWLVLGAVLVAVADLGLGIAFEHWTLLRIAVMAMVGFGVLSLLWARICHGFTAPLRKRKKLQYTFDGADPFRN